MAALNEQRLEKLISEAVREVMAQGGCEKKNGGADAEKKPETMTHLHGNRLVKKTHPLIAFRGEIDSLESEIIVVQQFILRQGYLRLSNDLEEIRQFIHSLIKYEITGERLSKIKLLGMDGDMIHEKSHHPFKYFGIHHDIPSAAQGEVLAYLNRLRTAARRTELAACKAFEENGTEAFLRPDIIMALNRISSLFHVMGFMFMTGSYEGMEVFVEASGRHIHLCRADAERLFGKDYVFEKVRDLSQPGQYVCRERLTIEGPKGKIDNVVILGPLRKHTQVEISVTDARVLGIEAHVRQSGDVAGTPGCTLFNQANGGRAVIDEGVIVAKRHIHLHTSTAKKWGLRDNETVTLLVGGSRGLAFGHTTVRVSDKFADYAHIDYDEANACLLKKGMTGSIIKTDGTVCGAKQSVTKPQEIIKPQSSAVAFEHRVLTEADLMKLKLRCGDGFRLRIPSACLVTPLAEDYIKNFNIEIERKL